MTPRHHHIRNVPARRLLLLLCASAWACGAGPADPVGSAPLEVPSSPTSLPAPGDPSPSPEVSPIGLRISPEGGTIDPGETLQLHATLIMTDSTETVASEVAWSSTNLQVLTVSSNGLAVGVGAGIANVVVQSGELTASARVIVNVQLYLSQISVGDMHTCGLREDGATFCWGGNNHGELGTGDYASHIVPVPAARGYDLESIVAGGGFTCAVATGGLAYCWGDDSMMELGTTNVGKTSPVPVEIAGGRAYTSVSGSQMAHACALEAAGTAWCWGYNRFGMVGHGILRDEPEPVMVAGGLSFSALHSSFFRTCGVDVVGSVHCWGRGGSAQIGDADAVLDICNGLDCALSPRPVDSPVRFTSVSVSRMHTCALGEDARPYCWGSNESGQLGVGGFDEVVSPSVVTIPAAVVSVTTGQAHACALTIDGRAYCWGDNTYGQLGNGSWAASDIPVPVAGDHTFAHLSAGYEQTCGQTFASGVRCWGNNSAGQLGIGTTEPANLPALVQFE